MPVAPKDWLFTLCALLGPITLSYMSVYDAWLGMFKLFTQPEVLVISASWLVEWIANFSTSFCEMLFEFIHLCFTQLCQHLFYQFLVYLCRIYTFCSLLSNMLHTDYIFWISLQVCTCTLLILHN